MARTAPGLGLTFAWGQGFDGYGGDMDNNLLLLSIVAGMTAISYTTSPLPAAATGAIYIVPASDATNPNKIAAVDNGNYLYFSPINGLTLFVTDQQKWLKYNSTLGYWEVLADYPESVGAPAQRNILDNGSFDIAQRGTSFTTTGSFVADRWVMTFSGITVTSSIVAYAGGTDLPEGTSKALSLAGTAGGSIGLFQRKPNVRRFNGRQATLSCYAKVTSGSATITSTMSQVFGTSGSTTANISPSQSTPVNLTSAWVRYVFNFNIPNTSAATIATDGTDYLQANLTFASSAAATVLVTDVQLEQGALPTPYEYRSTDLEMPRCLPYFEQFTVGKMGGTTATYVMPYGFKAQKRKVPTLTVVTAPTYTNASAFNAVAATVDGCGLQFTSSAAGGSMAGAVVSASAEVP